MTVYRFVQDTIEDMDIGDSKIISLPDNLGYFRKHLSEISQKMDSKFTTRVIGNKLHLMRTRYFNILSKEVK
jgi:hypothetical protein